MIFFITGLPRSRTKWFADYLSAYPETFCFHEAMCGCRTPDELGMRLKAIHCRRVGNSDSGLMFSDFQQTFMGARTLIIERDIEEVEQSLTEFAGESDYRPVLELQKSLLHKLHGLRVAFDEVDERLSDIHAYLGIPFDQDIADRFINEKINLENVRVDTASYRMWMGGH